MLINATDSVLNHRVTVTSAATQLVTANTERNGINVQLDPAAVSTTVVYLLLASSGTPSAANYDVAVTPTMPWDGMVGPVVWRGAIQMLASAAGPFNISAPET